LGSASTNANASTGAPPSGSSAQTAIAYRTESLPVAEFGVEVPVSVWYPVPDERKNPLPREIKYDYKISLRRIGQLLAKWEFIPEFVSKDFSLTPSASTTSTIRVVDGKSIPIPGGDKAAKAGSKVVFLAHGFLGSRSDLAYIAEDLASQGFVCVAAEYPESLEASYPRLEGLDRAAINKRLIPYVNDMVPQPILSYSAIGHSLGCGTVLQMGDDSWNRVLMGSGKAPESPNKTRKSSTDGDSVYKNPVVGGRLLFISSVNDSLTSWGGGIQIPNGYTVLQESKLQENDWEAAAAQSKKLDRVAVVFRGEKAPNHISYLSENVNDAMLSFLSPLLPVTQALEIPVLDFDKYKDSRDSVATGRALKPLISGFLAGAPESSTTSKS
jgi:predicted dienelactone hydrolase